MLGIPTPEKQQFNDGQVQLSACCPGICCVQELFWLLLRALREGHRLLRDSLYSFEESG